MRVGASARSAPRGQPRGEPGPSTIVASAPAGGPLPWFAPSLNGAVWALASDASWLWLGGSFTSVNGVARPGLATLQPTTGAVDPGCNPPWRSQGLWVASDTSHIGGETHQRIALMPVP
jgi:hypothetical protein